MKITIGRTVLYVLHEEDANRVNLRRPDPTVGNRVAAGNIYPAIAVAVWNHDAENPPVNFQVLLDGSDSYWATSRHEDATKAPGTWHWPERA